ncbi:MAG: hypothetical protein R3E42_11060 [Burkholderiaceae bacterium]
MGRAQFELGNFEGALDTFRMATKLTPSSVNRLLKHGMLAYYTGDRDEGLECSTAPPGSGSTPSSTTPRL